MKLNPKTQGILSNQMIPTQRTQTHLPATLEPAGRKRVSLAQGTKRAKTLPLQVNTALTLTMKGDEQVDLV